MKRLAIFGAVVLLVLTPAQPAPASIPLTVERVAVDIYRSASPGSGPVIVLDLPAEQYPALARHPKAEIIDYAGMDKRFRP